MKRLLFAVLIFGLASPSFAHTVDEEVARYVENIREGTGGAFWNASLQEFLRDPVRYASALCTSAEKETDADIRKQIVSMAYLTLEGVGSQDGWSEGRGKAVAHILVRLLPLDKTKSHDIGEWLFERVPSRYLTDEARGLRPTSWNAETTPYQLLNYSRVPNLPLDNLREVTEALRSEIPSSTGTADQEFIVTGQDFCDSALARLGDKAAFDRIMKRLDKYYIAPGWKSRKLFIDALANVNTKKMKLFLAESLTTPEIYYNGNLKLKKADIYYDILNRMMRFDGTFPQRDTFGTVMGRKKDDTLSRTMKWCKENLGAIYVMPQNSAPEEGAQ